MVAITGARSGHHWKAGQARLAPGQVRNWHCVASDFVNILITCGGGHWRQVGERHTNSTNDAIGDVGWLRIES